MPGLRLPIEICELVIDNLDDDKEPAAFHLALRACCLACKTFLPATRRRLFYHVNLTCREVAERFLDIICSLPSSTSPCWYVRKLSISDYNIEWISNLKALPGLAERLLDVTQLEFELGWDLLDDVDRRAILSGFLKVGKVKMAHGCQCFGTLEQMNQLIASFPSLVDLDCSLAGWRADDGGPLTDALPQGLKSIVLDSFHSPYFHRILSQHGSHSVRALEFYEMDGDDMEMLANFSRHSVRASKNSVSVVFILP